ncbi:WD40 repeat protein [Teratosphaeria destructans]|uniref:non-specific serine/threonine protein kinase n=1 Tax=Teratosphaeria destructans TaxID=418781 RepID=A0A9W7SHK0_9PEZI|nr:WD40 repeat protein [Teratosphaeria destructans]
MGQGYSTTLPPGPSAIETAEFSDLDFEKSLGGARFLRTMRARHQHGIVVAKVCMKANPGISFKKYAKALRDERQALKDVPNVLAYQRVRETNTFGLLVRQYVHTSLYDRISIRPFLEGIEKKWIAFQLLCAVRDCHSRGVFHGDIKSENVLVTSWCWVYLTDFASSFKPVYLPEDNPADFSYYYDTAARRTCYIAPERFLAAGQGAQEGNVVQWNMDIFSLGCVIAELFTETPTFTLSQLFRYRKGEYDPTASLLGKIDDEHVRALISSMIRLNPEERWHAQDYLDEYKGKAFPLYFYQHLHVLMQEITDPTSGRKLIQIGETNNNISDDRIDRVYEDFEMLSVSLGYGEAPASSPQSAAARDLFPLQVDLPNTRHTANASLSMTGDSGTFILLNVITSSMRSVGRSATKVRACELLLAFGERLPDEAKLDRTLPYIMPLLDDPNAMVLVAALRTMTQLLALVTVTSPVNSFLFTQYIFPRLQVFVNSRGFKEHAIVRATYAACLASLAETASRFLDMMQALRAEGSLPSTDKGDDNGIDDNTAYYDAYDATRIEVLEAFEAQTKVFLTDTDTAVKRAFLSSVPSLCVFFGEDRASDVILVHLNTYLNDTDWLLKCAFFKTVVGVAVFIGGASLEDFILPLVIGALTDPQEFVVEQALRSLASMAEIGLLQRAKTWELIDTVARFAIHPNIWIKEAAAHFVSAATTYLSVADIRILVTPLVQPYLKVPVSSLSESELLDALAKPLSRSVLEMAMEWARRTEKGLFWKHAKESRQLSYRAVNQMPPVSSVVGFGPRTLAKMPKNTEDEQWLGRLRNAGMRPEDEVKLLAFREYLWRAAQRSKRDVGPTHDEKLEQIMSLSRQLSVTPRTVIFDNDARAYEQRLREQGHAERTIAEALEEAVGPQKETGFRRLSLNGIGQVQNGTEQTDVAPAKPQDIQARQISGLKKQTSGSLSSSPGSAVGLLGEGGLRHRSSGTRLLLGADLRKASPAVATDDVTAAGSLNRPVSGRRSDSRASQNARRPMSAGPPGSRRRAIHSYEGNDPNVLRLLDTVYVENFPIDAAEFGPLVQPTKRGPVPYSSNHAGPTPWRPQGQLVAVLAEHTGKVNRIVVAPDNAFFLTGSDDGTVRVWDSVRLERNVTHRSRQTYKLADEVKVTSLCFIESTHTFVCAGSDGSVHVVKVEFQESTNTTKYGKLRLLREWHIPTSVSTTEFAIWSEHHRGDSGSVLTLATNLGRILAIDLRYMSIKFTFQNPTRHGPPTCFCTGRKKDWLLIGTSHGVLDLWDLRFGLRVRSWSFAHATPITRLQLHPSRKAARKNRVCVSGGTARGEVTVWDVEKAICHENLEEEKGGGLLGRLAGATAETAETAETAVSAPGVATSMHFSVHQLSDDAEALHTFAVTGGADGRVRFWDSDRLEGCRLVSGGGPDEKPQYSFSQLGLDIRVLTEKVATPSEASGAESQRLAPKKSGSGGAAKAAGKVSRYEGIRLSAQGLVGGHLDAVVDVAVLERPFGMVVSADRTGTVFVHQ